VQFAPKKQRVTSNIGLKITTFGAIRVYILANKAELIFENESKKVTSNDA